MKINHNKAHILGLFVGGGRINNDTFIIELPYKKWGMNPQKMKVIAVDILTRIMKIFQQEYHINITYDIGNSKWIIKPVTDSSLEALKDDLSVLGLPTSGFLLNTANLLIAQSFLKGINAESFLSGIFDSRASIALSHRRFNSEAPVVSIEIPASTQNFTFVVQLCSWLTDLGSTTDQILYNHPSQHAGADPFYKGWKKGFKIRFLIKSFLANNSFALQAKSVDASKIQKQQRAEEQHACPFRKIRKPSSVSVHKDIDSDTLPKEVRNKLFFHYFHFCAVLGCKHAPYEEVKKLADNRGKYISFFPRLSKGTHEEVSVMLSDFNDEHFNVPELEVLSSTVSRLIQESGRFMKYYGVEQGIAYLFSHELNGKRHIGSMQKIIDNSLGRLVKITAIKMADYEPIMITNTSNQRAFLVSSSLSTKNAYLISQKTEQKKYTIQLK